MCCKHLDVILNGGEAGVKDRTTVCTVRAADEDYYAVATIRDLLGCVAGCWRSYGP